MDRRKFLSDTSLSAAGIMPANKIPCNIRETEATSYDLMKDVMRFRKIDAHCHPDKDLEKQLETADRLGIDKIQISNPVTNFSGNESEGPEEVIKHNDVIIDAVKKYPGRFIGFFTLNPLYARESMEEIRRCAGQGLTGYKGYTQMKINDPRYYPVIEKLIDLKMIVFMHSFCQLGVGGYRMKYDTGRFPGTTLPEEMVDTAKRYPEGDFHFAHIGGGGDWEYECKMLKQCKNIYVDTGGSNNEENMIDFAIKLLGEDRIFFGTDNCYHHGIGKILASNATDIQKQKIFFDNYNNLLKKGGRYAD